jgi:hypothetical protein
MIPYQAAASAQGRRYRAEIQCRPRSGKLGAHCATVLVHVECPKEVNLLGRKQQMLGGRMTVHIKCSLCQLVCRLSLPDDEHGHYQLAICFQLNQAFFSDSCHRSPRRLLVLTSFPARSGSFRPEEHADSSVQLACGHCGLE